MSPNNRLVIPPKWNIGFNNISISKSTVKELLYLQAAKKCHKIYMDNKIRNRG